MRAGAHEVGDRTVEVTSPDRIVFDDVELTKGDLVAYHERIAPTMLPHVTGRPVAMKRYPEGLSAEGFFQRQAPEHLPHWVRREVVPKREGGSIEAVVVEEAATLVALAQFGVIELHPWLSLADDLERPDRLILDLDPADDDLDGARLATRAVGEVCDQIGLTPRLMTTGSSGYHVVVAIEPDAGFDEVRATARDIARVVAARHPERTTVEQRLQDRRGRVFLDYLRNGYGQTSVAPYGVRALPGAPVATPITWDELGSVAPRDYAVTNIFRRLGQRDDPWHDVRREDLGPARDRLAALLDER